MTLKGQSRSHRFSMAYPNLFKITAELLLMMDRIIGSHIYEVSFGPIVFYFE